MDNLSNRVIKGYELRERVGEGGFGAVYRAYQSGVGREVAIKVILPERANQPEFVRRFEVEAQLIARLEHPHIVPLYDYWRDPEGAYLVMRWLSGSVRNAIQSDPWTPEAAARLLEQIASALTVAHRDGVIHRDIKPDNILLDEDENAYLADFGIAKDLSVGAVSTTGEGMMVGSPAYITPEQIHGETVTARTDIYSLGLVLYEILVGEKPYPDATTPYDLINRHLNTPLPPIHGRRPTLPAALNEVLQTATAKDPARRYQSAQRFAAAFRAALPVIQRRQAQPLADPLTERELEILGLIVDGLSNQEIARKLVLSVGTVKWYVNQVFGKLDVHSRYQAVERARQLNLLNRGDVVDSIVVNVPAQMEGVQIVVNSTHLSRVEEDLVNPYKGLCAFQEADAEDFFGRAVLTEQLLSHLSDSGEGARFLAVVGPSGSGKSSVVRAGLTPALRRGALQESSRWFITEMLPGTHPLEELEAALLRVSVNPLPSLLSNLSEDRRGLVRAVKRVLPADQEVELVLVIDQFEELFTLVTDENVRQHFIDNLLSAAADPRSRVRIVLTMRADFYDRPLSYPRLAELTRSHTEFVIPLTSDELERAIAGPAERVGLTLEPRLVAAIINDLGEGPGTLPLLQYALTELFERRQDHTLTLDAYRESGGIRGALARRADELYEALDADGQAAARQLFLRLVTLGEGTEDTRRRVLQAELRALIPDLPLTGQSESDGEATAMDDVIATFSRYRLLTFDRDPLSRGPTVEIAHEALIREWKRLKEWLNMSRDNLYVHRRMMEASEEWMSSGQDKSYLATGARLTQFESLAVEGDLALTQDEKAYLEASSAERERQEAEARQQQARELELAKQAATSQRQSATRLRYLVAFLLIAAVGAFGLMGLAVNQQQRAENNEKNANNNAVTATVAQGQALNVAATSVANLKQFQAQRWASEADTIMQAKGGNVEAAGLLSVKAITTSYSFEAETALRQATTLNYPRQLFKGHTGSVSAVAFSPDGKFALTGGEDTTVRLWDVQTGLEVRRFTGHSKKINSLAFSPDGKFIFTGSDDGTARLWDAQTGTQPYTFTHKGRAVNSVTFSSDGKYALSGSDDGMVRMWDLQSGAELREFSDRGGFTIKVVAFSGDGKEVIAAESYQINFRVVHWETATGDQVRNFAAALTNGQYVGPLALSADAKYVLVSDIANAAWLYDTQAGSQTQQSRPFASHESPIITAAISPDGKYALTASDADSSVWLSDMQTGVEVSRFGGPVFQLASLALSADGRSILAGSSFDGTAWIWDLHNSTRWHELFGVPDSSFVLRTSPDGRYLVVRQPDLSVEVRAAQSGALVSVLDNRLQAPLPVAAFSPDSRYVATGDNNSHIVRLWDVQTGANLRNFDAGGAVGPPEFSPNGRYFLTTSAGTDAGGLTRVWDLWTNGPPVEFPGAAGVFSPDSKHVITGFGPLTDNQGHQMHSITDLEKGARLWDIATGQEVGQFTHHIDVNFLGLSPDGKYMVTFGAEFPPVWDTQKYVTLYRLDYKVNVLPIFSPDSRILLAAGSDDVIHLIDTQSGVPLRQFRLPVSVVSVYFTPDGRFFITQGSDGLNKVWDTDYQQAVRYLCARLVRDFTDAERTQYGIEDKDPTCPQFGTQTKAIPPAWTPIPTITLPIWTPIPSNTPGLTPTPTSYPTEAFDFPPTPTYEPTATP